MYCDGYVSVWKDSKSEISHKWVCFTGHKKLHCNSVIAWTCVPVCPFRSLLRFRLPHNFQEALKLFHNGLVMETPLTKLKLAMNVFQAVCAVIYWPTYSLRKSQRKTFKYQWRLRLGPATIFNSYNGCVHQRGEAEAGIVTSKRELASRKKELETAATTNPSV